jgi:hypothetical protein
MRHILTLSYHVSSNSYDVSFLLIFRFLEDDYPLPQPFLNKLNDQEHVVSYQDCSLYDLNRHTPLNGQ